jgi:hypothetical protein
MFASWIPLLHDRKSKPSLHPSIYPRSKVNKTGEKVRLVRPAPSNVYSLPFNPSRSPPLRLCVHLCVFLIIHLDFIFLKEKEVYLLSLLHGDVHCLFATTLSVRKRFLAMIQSAG